MTTELPLTTPVDESGVPAVGIPAVGVPGSTVTVMVWVVLRTPLLAVTLKVSVVDSVAP